MVTKLNGSLIRTVITVVMCLLAVASFAFAMGQGSAKKEIPQIKKTIHRMEERISEEEKISAVIGEKLTGIAADIKEIKEKMP